MLLEFLEVAPETTMGGPKHEYTGRDGDRSASSIVTPHVIESLVQLTLFNREPGSKRVRNVNIVEDERPASSIKIRKLHDTSLTRLINESFDTSVASRSHFHTAVSSIFRMSYLVQNMSSEMRCRFYSNKILFNRSRRPHYKSNMKLNKGEENPRNSSNQWGVKTVDDVKASNSSSSSSSSKANVRDTIMTKKKSLVDAVILARQEHGKLVVEYDVVTKQTQEKDATPLDQCLIHHDDKSVSSSSSPATTTIDEGDTSLDTDSDASVDEIMSVSESGEYSDVEAEKVPQQNLCQQLLAPCSSAVEALSGARKPPHSQRLSSSVVAAPPRPQPDYSGLEDEAQFDQEVLAGVQLLQSLRAL